MCCSALDFSVFSIVYNFFMLFFFSSTLGIVDWDGLPKICEILLIIILVFSFALFIISIIYNAFFCRIIEKYDIKMQNRIGNLGIAFLVVSTLNLILSIIEEIIFSVNKPKKDPVPENELENYNHYNYNDYYYHDNCEECHEGGETIFYITLSFNEVGCLLGVLIYYLIRRENNKMKKKENESEVQEAKKIETKFGTKGEEKEVELIKEEKGENKFWKKPAKKEENQIVKEIKKEDNKTAKEIEKEDNKNLREIKKEENQSLKEIKLKDNKSSEIKQIRMKDNQSENSVKENQNCPPPVQLVNSQANNIKNPIENNEGNFNVLKSQNNNDIDQSINSNNEVIYPSQRIVLSNNLLNNNIVKQKSNEINNDEDSKVLNVQNFSDKL